MRRVLFAISLVAGLMALAAPESRAEQAASVTGILRSSHTCRGMNISTVTATSVIVSTTQAYSFIAVENEDGTANLFCSERTSTSVSGGGRGKKVKPGKLVLWLLSPGMDWFCISDGSTSTASMTCKGK